MQAQILALIQTTRAERGLTLDAIDQGDVSKAELGAAGDAVFAVAEGGVAGTGGRVGVVAFGGSEIRPNTSSTPSAWARAIDSTFSWIQRAPLVVSWRYDSVSTTVGLVSAISETSRLSRSPTLSGVIRPRRALIASASFLPNALPGYQATSEPPLALEWPETTASTGLLRCWSLMKSTLSSKFALPLAL